MRLQKHEYPLGVVHIKDSTLHANGLIGRYIKDFGPIIFSDVDILDRENRLIQVYLSESRGVYNFDS